MRGKTLKTIDVSLTISITQVAPNDIIGLLKELGELAQRNNINIAPETERILKQLPARVTRSREDLLAVMENCRWDVGAAAEKLGITKAQCYSLCADKGVSVRAGRKGQ